MFVLFLFYLCTLTSWVSVQFRYCLTVCIRASQQMPCQSNSLSKLWLLSWVSADGTLFIYVAVVLTLTTEFWLYLQKKKTVLQLHTVWLEVEERVTFWILFLGLCRGEEVQREYFDFNWKRIESGESTSPDGVLLITQRDLCIKILARAALKQNSLFSLPFLF